LFSIAVIRRTGVFVDRLRAEIIERGVDALAVVKDFDVIEENALGAGAVGEGFVFEVQFAFEGGPEAFHGGVVAAAAGVARAGGEAIGEELLLVGGASNGRDGVEGQNRQKIDDASGVVRRPICKAMRRLVVRAFSCRLFLRCRMREEPREV